MALYSYQAFSKDGKKVKGVIDASSIANVKEQLTKNGLFPTHVELATEGATGGWRRFFERRVSFKDKILFTKQLAVLLKSGIPLLQALELLTEQLEGKLRTITVAVKDDVKEGKSFADSLAKYPRIFETIYIQLVRAGEASGNLEKILDRLVGYLERREAIRASVRKALQTPLIQLIVIVLVVALLLIKVIPTIAENLVTEGATLPLPTRIVMGLSSFLTGHYLLLIIIIAAIVGSFIYWRSTSQGARMLDKIKLRIPLVKYISKTSAVVQFSYALGMLLEGGVNLAEALDIVCAIIDNRILTDTLKEARDKIVKQGKIAQYLKQTDIFPPIAIYLIKTGEETGQLDAMLLTVAQNYEEEMRTLIDRLTSLIGPIMLVIMAIIVGFIIMSIMMPIIQMSEIAGGGLS
jgi:type II secretory pathway component PulF